MGLVEPLTITNASITPFEIPFKKPFSFAGTTVYQRRGLYLNIKAGDLTFQTEASPLEGVSQETLKKSRHDLENILDHLKNLVIPSTAKELISMIRKDARILSLCPSARFAVESALFMLTASSQNQSLSELLGGDRQDISSAALLQGSYDEVMQDARQLLAQGFDLFKLKVGSRNIPLDVKKVNDLRLLIGEDGWLRLDGNRVWSLNEALIFVEQIGIRQIEYIEEPLSDLSRLEEFYQKTHMPVALDETLGLLRCGIQAPGRCGPTLDQHPAVQAYILKPMILGGIVPVLDWIEEARSSGRKAIISACFESPVGIKILANLSLLTGHLPGLGTSRWLASKDLFEPKGIILKDEL